MSSAKNVSTINTHERHLDLLSGNTDCDGYLPFVSFFAELICPLAVNTQSPTACPVSCRIVSWLNMQINTIYGDCVFVSSRNED